MIRYSQRGSRLWLTACLACCLATVSGVAWAQAAFVVGRISVRLDRAYVLSDDADSVGIQVDVIDSQGNPAPDGSEVVLTSSAGRLEETSVYTTGGIARTRFYSGGEKECEAQIMALCNGKRAERSEVVFIQANPLDEQSGSRTLKVDADDYLAFFDDGQLVEGIGNARLKFRRIEITEAERLQVRISPPYCLNAKNATLSNGRQTVKTRWLYMEFRPDGVYGVALVEDPNPHTFEFVDEEFTEGQWFYPENKWRAWDTSESRVVIKADDVLLIPDQRLILNRARIYYDNVRLPLPLSAHVIPLSGGGALGSPIPQVVGVTYPGGLFVDYPWYLKTSEAYTAALRIRHGSPIGNYTSRKGWYGDFEVDYLKQEEGGGLFVVDGLGQKDWGARWSHNQRYSGERYGSYSINWPQHRYLSAYGNITTSGTKSSHMLNASWLSGAGMPQDWYVDSSWRFRGTRIAGFGFGYGVTLGIKQDGWNDEFYGRAAVTGSLALRKPWKVIGNFTLAPRASASFEQRTNGATESSALVGIEGSMRFSRMGSLRIAYDTQMRDGAQYLNGTRHYLRANLSYFSGGERGFSVLVSGTRDLDLRRSTFYGYANWEFVPKWSLQFTGIANSGPSFSYEDYNFGIGRRIGQAEARVLYSTQRNRVEFEFTRASIGF